jgi:hypothetical protein
MSVYRPSYRDSKTGEKKTSTIYWYGFTYAGKRIQESAKTSRKTVAKVAERKRRLELENARVIELWPKVAKRWKLTATIVLRPA